MSSKPNSQQLNENRIRTATMVGGLIGSVAGTALGTAVGYSIGQVFGNAYGRIEIDKLSFEERNNRFGLKPTASEEDQKFWYKLHKNSAIHQYGMINALKGESIGGKVGGVAGGVGGAILANNVMKKIIQKQIDRGTDKLEKWKQEPQTEKVKEKIYRMKEKIRKWEKELEDGVRG